MAMINGLIITCGYILEMEIIEMLVARHMIHYAKTRYLDNEIVFYSWSEVFSCQLLCYALGPLTPCLPVEIKLGCSCPPISIPSGA